MSEEVCKMCQKKIIEEHLPEREEKKRYPIVCSTCGKDATVPFKPNEGWKVDCLDCYNKRKK